MPAQAATILSMYVAIKEICNKKPPGLDPEVYLSLNDLNRNLILIWDGQKNSYILVSH
jgi:hypothetical protein